MGCDSQFDVEKDQMVSAKPLVKDRGPRVQTSVFPPEVFSKLALSTPGDEAKGQTGSGDSSFVTELTKLLNRKCQENRSNTPDFIIADYLLRSLEAFNIAVRAREDWYGVQLAPGGTNVILRQPRRG